MGRHRAIVDEDPDSGQRECRVCGRKIVGFGSDVRHAGEAVTIIVPATADAKAFADAVDAGAYRLGNVPAEASDTEKARAVVEAVYVAGLLRRKAGTPPDAEIPAETVRDWGWDEDAFR